MCRPSKLFRRHRVLSRLVLCLVPSATVPAAPSFGPLSSWDAAALQRARAGAASRLREPECQKVLSDFTDPEGRTLLDNLETWRQHPSDYLQQTILFLDGSPLRRCRNGLVVFATSRGRRAVFVCPAVSSPGSRFAGIQRRNPALAEAMVIHEMLHTLGLGENPPTTFEITDRVRARCG